MIQDFLASRRGPVYIYLIAWVVLFLWYWIFTNKADPTGFNDIAFKIVLPVFTFAASIPVGLTNDDGFYQFISMAFFGVMYMMLNWTTAVMHTMLAEHIFMAPKYVIAMSGAGYAFGGILLGWIVRWVWKKTGKDRGDW